MKKSLILHTLLVGMAALLLCGCSDSKKGDGGIDPSQLVGKWLLTSEYDEWVENGKVVGEYDPYDFEESYYLEFRKDGYAADRTVRGNISQAPVDEYRYVFDEEDNRIYWPDNDGFWDTAVYVEKLTSSELVLVSYYMEDGQRLAEKSIYKKVS